MLCTKLKNDLIIKHEKFIGDKNQPMNWEVLGADLLVLCLENFLVVFSKIMFVILVSEWKKSS